MRKTIFRLTPFLLLPLLLFTSCSSKKKSQRLEYMKTIPVEQRNNYFAFDIFNKINTGEEKNIVISPFSISTAMAMTYAGARGETAREMAMTLAFHPEQDVFHPEFSAWLNAIEEKGRKNNSLLVANSLWPHEGYHFRDEYFQLLRNYYRTGFYEVDYTGDREAIRNRINKWVANRTNNLIKDLIKPGVLIEDTRLVLVNAIYFLEQWQIAFDPDATHDNIFYTSDGQEVTTPLMFMRDRFRYTENDDFQAIELQYKGGDFSMVIMLPTEGNSLSNLTENLDPSSFNRINQEMMFEDVEVYLPSFQIRSGFDLERTLIAMGMPLAFSNRADFGGMTTANDLKIDKVIHQAFIDVKEEGTEAAASTAVVMIRKSAVINDDKTIFRADRPFVYFIKENQGNSIIFMGKVGDPTVKPTDG